MAQRALEPASHAARPAPRAIDTAALQRVRARLAAAAHAPWLHAEVARRMAERLPVIRQRPRRMLDWWPASSASAALLRDAYPRTPCQPVWPSGVPLPDVAAARWWSPRRWRPHAASTASTSRTSWTSPVAPRHADTLDASAGDLLWANMSLHWCADPLAEMRRWHAVLEADGFLMFSTLGPGTLATLRELYRAQGWGSPHAAFVDMHDLGDMLVEAGFADPVMDQETLTLTWPDAAAALAELRPLGANVDPARHPGLRTPRWRDRLHAALAAAAPDPAPGAAQGAAGPGRVALAFEIVYGHAFRPRPRPRVAARTTVGLEDMRSILRARPEQ
jgi:malonyl-CoA O-methyltransferase